MLSLGRWKWTILFRGIHQNVYKLRYLVDKRLIHVPSSPMLKKIPSTLKGKGKSSQLWLTRQLNDPYVKKAHEMNYRARSAFKLIEIDDKAQILKPGQTVVECGAAPGAWTQIIIKRINSDGRVPKKPVGTVIGIDLLPIAPLEGAVLLGGFDFTTADTLEMVKEILKSKVQNRASQNELSVTKSLSSRTVNSSSNSDEISTLQSHSTEKIVVDNDSKQLVDVILSDMAPNATGNRDTDHPRIVKLVEQALKFSIENGKTGSHFLAKVWDGGELKRLENCMSEYYDKVSRYKPPSSRNDSSEIFILGKFKR